jgi:hypothetical protein
VPSWPGARVALVGLEPEQLAGVVMTSSAHALARTIEVNLVGAMLATHAALDGQEFGRASLERPGPLNRCPCSIATRRRALSR